MPTPPIHLHLIAYDEATRIAASAPGWRMLDNLANPRPDWYEYWPIRQHLLAAERAGALDDAAFYGFFSPKFTAKTGLDHAAVSAFVATHAAKADVLLFSPQPDMGAFFLNVFEQGETFDAGLIDAYGRFLAHLGRPVPLRQLVMDARQVVFSNYFVARPPFWREWLRLNEALFEICEGEHHDPAMQALKRALTVRTSYGGGAQRKVFLMERAASLLLATQPQWASVPHDPFGFGWSTARFREFPQEAFVSDALKRAWRDTRWPEYMEAFGSIRDRFVAAGAKAA
ncbi:MAG: hypothetical protein HZC37_02610 [Burkholderiales bacterium]|nr:hypothetical protein [Burkholderiales bacterium]